MNEGKKTGSRDSEKAGKALGTRKSENQASAIVRLSNPDFEKILDISSDAVISIDYDRKIIFFNKAAEKVFGYTSTEILGKSLDILLPERSVKSHGKHVQDFSASSKQHMMKDERREILGRRKDGSEFPAEASISKLDAEAGKILTVMLRDISKRKEAEKLLREGEERYRLFFTDDLSGDFIATPEGAILECNAAFLQIFGFHSFKEAETTKLNSLFIDDKSYQEFLGTLKNEKRLKHYETEFRHFSNKIIYVVANFIGRFSSSGDLVEIKGYLFNITETKKIEKQLFHAQKMEAIGRLAGGVAHDFNNTLTAISGFSDLLLDSCDKEGSQYMILKEVKSAAESATSLTKQLLAFSRKQILQFKVLNINSIVKNTWKMLRRVISEQIELNAALDDNLGKVKADPVQIEQIIMNLAVNARDAMEHGGRLTIETKNVTLDENYTNQHMRVVSGRYVMLAVSDNGIGMDEETQLQIFEPFFSTKKKGKGTGLGLSTVYGIVVQSNGYIWVYSEPGHGSTFKIYFPRVEEGIEEAVETEESEQLHSGTETILLVEDDEKVRKMVYYVLSANGYKIFQAANGNEALEISRTYEEDIHLMITDIVMPEISGLELGKKMEESHPDMKVLYMSGYTDNSVSHHEVLEPGINYLEKPFNARVLSDIVRKLLDR